MFEMVMDVYEKQLKDELNGSKVKEVVIDSIFHTVNITLENQTQVTFEIIDGELVIGYLGPLTYLA